MKTAAMRTAAPRVVSPDSTLLMWLEGYPFASRRARRFHSDVFRGRLFGQPAIFVRGADAAAVFYSASLTRADAAPSRVVRSLFGHGGVQTLDGEEHRRRKAAFMSLMTRDHIDRFLALAEEGWRAAADRWPTLSRVTLMDEAAVILFGAACRWSGVPMRPQEVGPRAHDCRAMVEGLGAAGPRMWNALAARWRIERWAQDLVQRVRDGTLQAPEGSALDVFARYRDVDGALLPIETAAVELLNVLRPITAIGRYVVFLALALHDHPRLRARLLADDDLVEGFIHEVRRLAPFTPMLVAWVTTPFEWRGVRFEVGARVVLDVYGTLRDPRRFEAPEELRPERWRGREPSAFDLIPQGGGAFATGHRCAGEWLTIEVMKQALRVLTRELTYEVPAQDLGYSLRRMPTAPRSGFVMTHVARVPTDAHSFERGAGRGLHADAE